ncbi:MAG: protein phosphatase 2C domain-containing protein [bacterium]|nr:protein phosphatase 2C domain-containing protein [bacterium]
MNYEFPDEENKAEQAPIDLEFSVHQRKNEVGKEMQDGHFIDDIDEDSQFFAVMDGFGPLGAKAVEAVKDELNELTPDLSKPSDQKNAEIQMERILSAANLAVIQGGAGKDQESGSTLVMVRLWKDKEKAMLTASWIGDSRIYLLRDGKIRCVSLDDGLLTHISIKKGGKELARKKQEILNNANSEKDIEDDTDLLIGHHRGNILDTALGANAINPTQRCETLELQEGDKILLCSDGVSDNLTDKEIEEKLNQSDTTDQIGQNLLDQSAKNQADQSRFKRKSYIDDMKLIVIRVAP